MILRQEQAVGILTALAVLATLLLACGCAGCGSVLASAGRNTAVGALDAVTDKAATERLEALAAATAKAARDEALGPATVAAAEKLVAVAGVSVQRAIDNLATDTLQTKVRRAVRAAMDEALGRYTLQEASALREEMAGMPLQRDLDALIDAAAPHLSIVAKQVVESALQGAIIELAPLKKEGDEEAERWRPIALGFAVGCACLMVCLAFAVFAVRSHRQVIEKLLAQRRG